MKLSKITFLPSNQMEGVGPEGILLDERESGGKDVSLGSIK
jgi:hypothetical protein